MIYKIVLKVNTPTPATMGNLKNFKAPIFVEESKATPMVISVSKVQRSKDFPNLYILEVADVPETINREQILAALKVGLSWHESSCSILTIYKDHTAPSSVAGLLEYKSSPPIDFRSTNPWPRVTTIDATNLPVRREDFRHATPPRSAYVLTPTTADGKYIREMSHYSCNGELIETKMVEIPSKTDQQLVCNLLNELQGCSGGRGWKPSEDREELVFESVRELKEEEFKRMVSTYGELATQIGFTREMQVKFSTHARACTSISYDPEGQMTGHKSYYQMADRDLLAELVVIARRYFSACKTSFFLGLLPGCGAQSSIRRALATNPIFEPKLIDEIFEAANYTPLRNSK